MDPNLILWASFVKDFLTPTGSIEWTEEVRNQFRPVYVGMMHTEFPVDANNQERAWFRLLRYDSTLNPRGIISKVRNRLEMASIVEGTTSPPNEAVERTYRAWLDAGSPDSGPAKDRFRMAVANSLAIGLAQMIGAGVSQDRVNSTLRELRVSEAELEQQPDEEEEEKAEVSQKGPRVEEIARHFAGKNWTAANFKVTNPLGRGGYGFVYRAFQGNYPLVIKVMFKNEIIRKRARSWVQREIENHEQLRNRNILRMYGHFEDEKRIVLMLEYASGGDLYKLLQQQPDNRFPEARTKIFLRQVIGALIYCHSKGILHRDVKPDNILLDGNGVIKLADFGLSVHVGSGRRHTDLGSIDYMAPEVLASGENRNSQGYTYPVDSWAVGVLCYELLTGETPFYHEDRRETAELISRVRYNIPDSVSPEARAFIKAMLRKTPGRRLKLREALLHPFLAR